MEPLDKHKKRIQLLQDAITSSSTKELPDRDVMELMLSYFVPSNQLETYTDSMLDKFDTVACAMDANLPSVSDALDGNELAAEFFNIIPMLGTYYRMSKLVGGRRLAEVDEIAEYCTFRFSSDTRENLFIILLNSQLKMIGSEIISTGDEGGVYSDTQKMAEAIFGYGASAYILVHNHPNGNAEPSDADLALTEKATRLFDPFNKTLIEHLIVSGASYYPIAQMMRYGKLFPKTTL